jgi:hypothetical protein
VMYESQSRKTALLLCTRGGRGGLAVSMTARATVPLWPGPGHQQRVDIGRRTK